jgi:hypothetical protein
LQSFGRPGTQHDLDPGNTGPFDGKYGTVIAHRAEQPADYCIIHWQGNHMTDIPNFRPADRITNPELFELARQRWPGAVITSAALEDIAKLTGEMLYVPATRENVAAGMAEVQREQRRAEQQRATARDYASLGFDPAVDYRNPPSTEK